MHRFLRNTSSMHISLSFLSQEPVIDELFLSTQAEAAEAKAKQLEKDASRYTKEGVEKLDQLRQDSAKEMNQSLDNLDKTVEKKTSEAKSGISNWFGGSK